MEPISFLPAIVNGFISLFKGFFLNIQQQKKDIREALRNIDEQEADRLILVAAKYQNSINEDLFLNKKAYLDLFYFVEALLAKIDQKWFICKKQKEVEIADVIKILPNNIRWLISIYCVQQGEKNSLTVLWKKYAKLIVITHLHRYTSFEMAEMSSERFNNIYPDNQPEADKFYYERQLIALAHLLNEKFGIKISTE